MRAPKEDKMGQSTPTPHHHPVLDHGIPFACQGTQAGSTHACPPTPHHYPLECRASSPLPAPHSSHRRLHPAPPTCSEQGRGAGCRRCKEAATSAERRGRAGRPEQAASGGGPEGVGSRGGAKEAAPGAAGRRRRLAKGRERRGCGCPKGRGRCGPKQASSRRWCTKGRGSRRRAERGRRCPKAAAKRGCRRRRSKGWS